MFEKRNKVCSKQDPRQNVPAFNMVESRKDREVPTKAVAGIELRAETVESANRSDAALASLVMMMDGWWSSWVGFVTKSTYRQAS